MKKKHRKLVEIFFYHHRNHFYDTQDGNKHKTIDKYDFDWIGLHQPHIIMNIECERYEYLER